MTNASTPHAGTEKKQASRTRLTRVRDAVLACVLQIAVLLTTAPLGLGWGGFTYAAAMLLSALGVFVTVPIALLARRSSWAFFVPALSLASTGALLVLGGLLGHLGA